ncbi:hypothetical protein BUY37_11765 [Staphylococcus cohnii]|uniref:Uncharacterized protein n=1 Tax=Staphylococcus cohnii TaxID=29382 RepID=A0A2T4LQE4_9STAP|nr:MULTISPECIES: hypothetical protein [Staphylococcus]PTF17600.1 hypothetical protein BUY40_12105 [Staphylococcus cohnii]PTF22826.1 hypothetical protein BUY30_11175 [Staphylococcus cohnii]PTF29515.1 hypothetical protein BUY31_02160 [Staphylococcus cohnii]PTF34111.1 hypothetical protein BUY21_03940 [Staphylococcus cohnii]PTF65558.1 hypothetical protein BUY34_10635 [Staphylococcus cohnii]
MNINSELDTNFFISIWLNILFLFGLIFITQLENLVVLIPYVLVMGVNSIYLVIKAMKIRNNRSL